jgi:hypothetical protein
VKRSPIAVEVYLHQRESNMRPSRLAQEQNNDLTILSSCIDDDGDPSTSRRRRRSSLFFPHVSRPPGPTLAFRDFGLVLDPTAVSSVAMKRPQASPIAHLHAYRPGAYSAMYSVPLSVGS